MVTKALYSCIHVYYIILYDLALSLDPFLAFSVRWGKGITTGLLLHSRTLAPVGPFSLMSSIVV